MPNHIFLHASAVLYKPRGTSCSRDHKKHALKIALSQQVVPLPSKAFYGATELGAISVVSRLASLVAIVQISSLMHRVSFPSGFLIPSLIPLSTCRMVLKINSLGDFSVLILTQNSLGNGMRSSTNFEFSQFNNGKPCLSPTTGRPFLHR